MRVDARDLWRDVGAHAEQAAGQRVDDLERLQLEIPAGAREQRVEMLDQRWLHEPVAVRAEMVEQRAAQRFRPLGFRREDVLYVFRQDPFTHAARARYRQVPSVSMPAR